MKTVIVLISETSLGLEAKVNNYLKEYEKYDVRVINYTSQSKDGKLEYSGMIERENERMRLISRVKKDK